MDRSDAIRQFFGVSFGSAVQHCSEWLLDNALDVEGIFRPLTDERDVEMLRFKVEKGVDISLDAYRSPEGCRIVAELYKQFFRYAAQPVFPVNQYDTFISVFKQGGSNVKESVRALLVRLPPVNLAVLNHLVGVLRAVSARSSNNCMPASNLAIVFAPYLLRSPRPSVMQSVSDAPHVNGLVQMILEDPRMLVADERAAPGMGGLAVTPVSVAPSQSWRPQVDPGSPPANRSPRFQRTLSDPAPGSATSAAGPLSPSSSGNSSQDVAAINKLVAQSCMLLFDQTSPVVTSTLEVVLQVPSAQQLQQQRARIADRFGPLGGVVASAPLSGPTRSGASSAGSAPMAAPLSGGAPAGAAPKNGDLANQIVAEGTAFLRRSLEALRRERVAAGRPAELNRMTSQQLRHEKSAIKRELRSYDSNFAKTYGREPSKIDKEPMRPLYQRYKDVKQMLGLPSQPSQTSVAPAAAQVPAAPTSAPLSGGSAPSGGVVRQSSSGALSASGTASLSATAPVASSAALAAGAAVTTSAPPSAQLSATGPAGAAAGMGVAGVTAGVARVSIDVNPAKLVGAERERVYTALKSEKRALQIRLTEFQKEFIRVHGRKVKYREDRLPMEDEYQRYKAIKQKLAEFDGTAASP